MSGTFIRNAAKGAAILMLLFSQRGLSEAGGWPVFHAGAQRDGQSAEAGVDRPVIKWRFKTLYRYGSPVVDGRGNVYAVGGDASYLSDTVYSIAPDGKARWKYNDDAIFFPPAIAPDGVIYVLSVKAFKTYLLSIDPLSGKKRWEALVCPYMTARAYSPVMTDSRGRIYADACGAISAFNSRGDKEWSYRFPQDSIEPPPDPVVWLPEPATGPTLSPDEKEVYIFKRIKGGLYAFTYDGQLKWRDPGPYYTDFSYPSAAGDGTIYTADSISSSIYAIAADGRKRWKAALQGNLANSNVAIGRNGMLYLDMGNAVTGSGGSVICMDPKDGRVVWEFKVADGYLVSAIAIDREGNLYFGSGDGYVYSLSPEGKLRWKVIIGEKVKHRTDETLAQIYMSSPVLSGKTLYIVTGKGLLFAIGE